MLGCVITILPLQNYEAYTSYGAYDVHFVNFARFSAFHVKLQTNKNYRNNRKFQVTQSGKTQITNLRSHLSQTVMRNGILLV